MIQIPKKELLESLEYGYNEFKTGMVNGESAEDLAHVKGFCTTIEQILATYGGVSVEEMLKIKRPIIGDVSLRRVAKKHTNNNKSDTDIDYEIPTIFRKISTKGE